MSLSEKLANRTFPTKDVVLCLDGALSQEHAQAMQAVVAAQQKSRERLASGGGLKAAQAHVAEIETRMRDSLVTVRVIGIPFALYNKIQHAHPPRKGHPEAFNPLTFFTDVVYKSSELIEDDILVKLTDTPRGEWDAFVEALTDAEFGQLARAVTDVNNTGREFGFLGQPSETIPDLSETSDSLETLE